MGKDLEMRSSGFTALFIVVLIALTIPVLALEAGQEAPKFELKDQFDVTWSLSELKGDVVVLIAATPKSGEAMGPWVTGLENKYGDQIKLVGMMNLHSLPGFIRSIAKSRIRKKTEQPLMLDYTGSTSKTYGVNDQNPVVVVIDSESRVQAVAGPHSEEAFASFTAVIDGLLAAQQQASAKQ